MWRFGGVILQVLWEHNILSSVTSVVDDLKEVSNVILYYVGIGIIYELTQVPKLFNIIYD